MMGLGQHSYALGASLFDIGSDFYNALNLLGVFHNSMVNEALPGHKASYSISNHTNISCGIDEAPIDEIKTEVHQIWGIMSMVLIFLPGFVLGFPLGFQCFPDLLLIFCRFAHSFLICY